MEAGRGCGAWSAPRLGLSFVYMLVAPVINRFA